MANPSRRPESASALQTRAPAAPAPPSDQAAAAVRDQEMEAWLDHALRSHHADPEPVLRDLD